MTRSNAIKFDRKFKTLVSVSDYDAVGNGSTNDYTAINSAITAVKTAGGGIVYFPRPIDSYACGSTLQGSDGVRLEGPGLPDRWRSTRTSVKIKYTGSGSAIALTPAAAVGIDSFQICNLHIDGTTAAVGTIGLYLNASAAGSYIEGVLVENTAITNFPANQVKHVGTVFDVTYSGVNLSNPDRASTSHSAWIVGPESSQVTFDGSWISQYTDGMWCVVSENGDTRFFGGTIAPYGTGGAGNGAHGVQVSGSLNIYGTHFENYLDTNTDNIGIQYLGSGGAFISPSECARFGIGVKIGDGTATAARGWTIAGNVGNNQTQDVLITNGGSRVGAIIEIGFANGAPTITDNRYDLDSISEVVRLENGTLVGPIVYAAPGTDIAPGLSFRSASTRGFYDTGTSIGVATGGGKQAEFTGTDLRLRTRILPGTPAGVIQTSAGIYGGAGAPSNADGGDGEFYFRSDGTKAGNTAVYHKEAGVWVALVTA